MGAQLHLDATPPLPDSQIVDLCNQWMLMKPIVSVQQNSPVSYACANARTNSHLDQMLSDKFTKQQFKAINHAIDDSAVIFGLILSSKIFRRKCHQLQMASHDYFFGTISKTKC